METPQRTKAREVSWTAAPGPPSPCSSGTTSPSVDEEPLDFLHLMDEDGIIGLSEAVEGGGWGEPADTGSHHHHPSVFSGTSGPEGTGTPTEELSSSLSERPSLTQSLCESRYNYMNAIGFSLGEQIQVTLIEFICGFNCILKPVKVPTGSLWYKRT